MASGLHASGRVRESGRWAGYAAATCAFLFALTSFYWGFGGTFALDTVGREAVDLIEAGDLGVYVAVWFAGLVKVGAPTCGTGCCWSPAGEAPRP